MPRPIKMHIIFQFQNKNGVNQNPYGNVQGEAKVDKKRTLKIIQHMLKVPEEASYQERIQICHEMRYGKKDTCPYLMLLNQKKKGKQKKEK